MPKPKKSKWIEQKPSTDSILTVNTIIEETRRTFAGFSCCIKNYSLLERRIFHTINHREHSHWWKVYIRKWSGMFFIYLNTDIFIETASFSFQRSDGKTADIIPAKTNVVGIYGAEFDESEISNPENLLLQDDTLICECAYIARPSEYNIVLTRGLQEKSVESIHNSYANGLCNEFKHLYLNSRFSNFTIVAESTEFKVHRLILSLHSHYFAELFRKAPDLVPHHIEIDASPVIVHEVLLYVYSGELMDMKFTYMIDIFHIACKWQITRLMQICIHYFKANFAANNLVEILCTAYHYNVLDLVHEGLRFIYNLPQCVKEKGEWADVIHEIFGTSGLSNC